MEKEISNFNKLIGFDDDDSSSSSSSEPGGINPEVIAQLEAVADNANPEPPQIKKLSNEEQNEDLKSIEPDLELPYTKQDKTDYKDLFKSTFGQDNPEIKTRSDFELEATKIHYRDEFFKQYNLAPIDEAIEGKLPKDEVIKQVTENNLRSQKLFTQRLYDEQIAQYINEGVLSEEGEKRYQEIIKELKSYKSQVEQGAEEYASNKAKELAEINSARIAATKSFNPLGLSMPEEWKEHIADVITGGDLYNFISNPSDQKEAVEREMWLAIVASPKARAEFFKAIYEKGVKHGVAKKAKTVFS